MNNTKPFVLVVEFTAKPGKEAALKDILTTLVLPTLKEPGCLEYRLHTSLNNPRQFMFYEIWASREAHAMHGKTAHMAKWHAVKHDLFESIVKTEWNEI